MVNAEHLNNLHNSIPPDYYEVGIKNNIFQKYWQEKKIKVIKKILNDLKGDVTPVLDLGCHGGWLTNKISKTINSNNVYGVDLSKSAIDYAKRRYKNLFFLQTNLENKIPFSDEKFKLVAAFDIMEHVSNTNQLIREISRILKQNGYFIIGMDTESLLFKVVWWLWLKMRGRVWRETHIHRYKIKELEKLIKKENFIKINEIKIHLKMYWIAVFKKR